jgi:hypothetical protein
MLTIICQYLNLIIYRSEIDRVDYEISDKFNIIKNNSDID